MFTAKFVVTPEPQNTTHALVLGGANTVWSDIDALFALWKEPWCGLVFAANDVGVWWPYRLDYWCSLHMVKMPPWETERKKRGYPLGYKKGESHRSRPTTYPAKRQITPRDLLRSGSSGALAVAIAIELDVKRIVLCGVPMDNSTHFKESAVHVQGRPWGSSGGHWRAWVNNKKMLAPVVRSFSGRTRKEFGSPTLEWLQNF